MLLENLEALSRSQVARRARACCICRSITSNEGNSGPASFIRPSTFHAENEAYRSRGSRGVRHRLRSDFHGMAARLALETYERAAPKRGNKCQSRVNGDQHVDRPVP